MQRMCHVMRRETSRFAARYLTVDHDDSLLVL